MSMAEIRYTKAQQQAIYDRNGDMLVSAAAGSGKTSVLSARVSALIEEGAEIRRMLIVTFTSKAAMEMRGRIRRALEQNAREKAMPRLAMQAEQADSADICTIHSFAAKVIKENFVPLGLNAQVHAAGEEQIALYQAEAMEELLQELYEREDAQFLLLRDRYSGRDDTAITREILHLYNYCMSRPEGIEWIKAGGQARSEAYLEIVEEQNLAELGRLEDVLAGCIQLEQQYVFPAKQLENNREDLALAQRLKELYAQDLSAYSRLLAGAKIPAIARKIESEAGKQLLQEYKKQARLQLKKLQAALPQQAEELIRSELPYMQEMSEALYHVVSRFDQLYGAIKREHSAIDYDDMLRLAYRALSEPQIAEAYSARYDYVFIDEYQDTNPIQEALLSCLKPQGGRFMVGDMKQSVYRFRLTDPLIFRQKAAAGSGVQVIRMNENFRSGSGIIRAVNRIMSGLMSEHLGELAYTRQEALLAGRSAEGCVELMLTDAGDTRDTREAARGEARNIARRVKALLQERDEAGIPRYTQGDICLLLRNMEGYAGIYGAVLAEEGLDIRINTGGAVYPAASEMFLNLLKVIDGFTSDLALLSVMKSFMGGFADADLAYIRAQAPAESFAESLLEYAQGHGQLAGQCRTFLEKIERYRDWAEVMTVKELLIRLKLSERYEAHLLAMPAGEEKHKLFADFFAKLLEWAGEQPSLYDLLNYVSRVRSSGGLAKSTQEASGAVQIMSIHAAKGLEFPIVFVARMGTRFSARDKSAQFLLHDRLGITMDMVDEKKRLIRRSFLRELAEYEQEKEQKSEELRVLYVAMTRARERLIFSAALKDPEQRMQSLRKKEHWYELLEMRSMLDWLLAACLQLPEFDDWQGEISGAEVETMPIVHKIIPVPPSGAEEMPRTMERHRILQEAAQLPHAPFLQYENHGVPVKVGVSALLPQDEQGAWVPGYQGHGDAGAELGTLIHLLMQHLDFSARSEAEVLELIETLRQRNILSEAEAVRIQPFAGRVAKFLRSEIAGRARSAKELRREIPFSLLLPARELGLGESEEQVMLQGIIDLAFPEEDGYVIVDYKSNMVDEAHLAQLAGHYRLQMQLYRLALEQVTGRPVKACYLWFLRQEREFAIYSQN